MHTRQWPKWWKRLRPLLLAAALSLSLGMTASTALAVPQGGYAHPEALLQPEELKARLDQKDSALKIIDVRHDVKYYLGHIPGAVQVWRHDLEIKKPAASGLPLAAAQLEKLMGRLGISTRDTVVLYSDQFDHTWLWWLLAYYGFPLERLKILDGGLEAWKAKGYPTQLTSPRLKRASFKLPQDRRVDSLLATLQDLKSAIRQPGKVVLDDRTQRQYLGEEREEGAARAGRIPGAVWVEWKETRVSEGPYKSYFKPAPQIKELYAAQGVTPDKDIYLYSRMGLKAAHSLVSLYLAGFPLEKLHLYAGSWTEWSHSKEAIETGQPRSGK